MKKAIFIAAIALMASMTAQSWEGYDYENGESVSIESGNLVRPGEEIEVYNYDSGEYEYHEVQSIREYGGSVEVETYDYEDGEYHVLEMDR